MEYKRGKLPIISWICDDAAHGKLHIYGKLEPVHVAEYQSGGAQCNSAVVKPRIIASEKGSAGCRQGIQTK